MMNNRYANAQEYCIGRFVVEVPEFLSFRGGDSRYNGVTMRHEIQSDIAYQKNLDDVVNEYRYAGKDMPSGYPSRYPTSQALQEVVNLPHGDIVRYGQRDLNDGFVRIPPNTWTLRTNRFEKMKSTVEKLEFRPEPGASAVPERRGYCVIYGFIPESSPSSNEWEERVFRKDDDPNFFLNFTISNIGHRRKTLAELEDDMSNVLSRFIFSGELNVEKRAEPISLGFIEGEQSIDATTEPAGRFYNMIAQGNGSDPEKPFIQVRMESGAMPREESDKLWYSILGSLKPRPGAFN